MGEATKRRLQQQESSLSTRGRIQRGTVNGQLSSKLHIYAGPAGRNEWQNTRDQSVQWSYIFNNYIKKNADGSPNGFAAWMDDASHGDVGNQPDCNQGFSPVKNSAGSKIRTPSMHARIHRQTLPCKFGAQQ